VRGERAVSDLARIAFEQGKSSRAPDYWHGVEDALRWVLGGLPAAIDARLMVEWGTSEPPHDALGDPS
jgi:hypothetical protein